VAEVIPWNSAHGYTNEEDKVPTILTQGAGAALILQGAFLPSAVSYYPPSGFLCGLSVLLGTQLAGLAEEDIRATV
jgi:hypothetical protein